MTESESRRRIPADSFGIRLAIVRAEMGWNYDQAQAATGVSSESWRLWERGRHCTDVIGVSKKIAQVTDYDQTWLAFGGPLTEEEPHPDRRRRRVAAASTSRVSSVSTGQLMSPTRVLTRNYLVTGNIAAA